MPDSCPPSETPAVPTAPAKPPPTEPALTELLRRESRRAEPEPPSPTITVRRALLALAAAGVAAVAVIVARQWAELSREAALMTGIFVLAALLWVTEALPPYATSLAVIGLEILLLANPGNWPGLGFESGDSPRFQSILAAAVDPVVMLFFGGFLLAQAAVKEGVDQSMSSLLLKPFGSRPGVMMLGVMLATALFSMWMSNTATTAMMLALVAPMLVRMEAGEPFRKGLLLAVPFAANIGGIGTPIGSPPNAVALGFLRNIGLSVGFLKWMAVAVPLMLGLLAVCWIVLWMLYRPRERGLSIEITSRPIGRRGMLVVVVFIVTVLLWLSEAWHGLPAAVVALLPALVFTATGLLDRRDVNSLEWNILILIAGGIALGAGMQMTGLDKTLADRLMPGDGTGAMVALAALVLVTTVLSTFMSNTAAANLLLPVGISIAVGMGADGGLGVMQVALSIAFAASLSMALPISTPPNAIAYARGGITTREMAMAGTVIGLIGCAAVVLFGSPVLRFWGLR